MLMPITIGMLLIGSTSEHIQAMNLIYDKFLVACRGISFDKLGQFEQVSSVKSACRCWHACVSPAFSGLDSATSLNAGSC